MSCALLRSEVMSSQHGMSQLLDTKAVTLVRLQHHVLHFFHFWTGLLVSHIFKL